MTIIAKKAYYPFSKIQKSILLFSFLSGLLFQNFAFAQSLFPDGDFTTGPNLTCACPTGFQCADDASRVVDGVHPEFLVLTPSFCSTGGSPYTQFPIGGNTDPEYVFFFGGFDNIISTQPALLLNEEIVTISVWYAGPTIPITSPPQQDTEAAHFAFTIDGIEVSESIPVPTGTAWTQFQFTTTVPAGTHYFGINGGDPGRHVMWFDNFEAVITTATTCGIQITGGAVNAGAECGSIIAGANINTTNVVPGSLSHNWEVFNSNGTSILNLGFQGPPSNANPDYICCLSENGSYTIRLTVSGLDQAGNPCSVSRETDLEVDCFTESTCGIYVNSIEAVSVAGPCGTMNLIADVVAPGVDPANIHYGWQIYYENSLYENLGNFNGLPDPSGLQWCCATLSGTFSALFYITVEDENGENCTSLKYQVDFSNNCFRKLLRKEKPQDLTPQLYPNPASTQLEILFPDINLESANIEVYDLLGNLVLFQPARTKISQLNISNLSGGPYFIKIRSKEQQWILNFIKTKN